jgi:hypothetical protein
VAQESGDVTLARVRAGKLGYIAGFAQSDFRESPGSGIAVVGIARGAFRPDVAVKGSAEDERRAYDALEKGAMLSMLLTDNPNKVRNDEASLAKDRLAEASAEAATDAGKKESPPIDAALQRAVHLHRALVALKKI